MEDVIKIEVKDNNVEQALGFWSSSKGWFLQSNKLKILRKPSERKKEFYKRI